MTLAWRFAYLLGTTALLWLAACASPPKPPPPPPTIMQAALQAQPTVNPDARGRASPIVVRVYILKSRAAFDNAAFFSLYEKDQETLGTALVESEELQLMPGEKREVRKQLPPEAHFVGIFAAFRDVERSQWREAVSVAPHQVNQLNISLEGNNVSISAGK